jgi:NAD(P)-dependent dehydrogenase (short-subunit alcohol dehydrogenase family)
MLPDWVVQTGLTAGTADPEQAIETVAARIAPVIRALFGGGRALNVTFSQPSDQAEVDSSSQRSLSVDAATGLEDIYAQLKSHADALAGTLPGRVVDEGGDSAPSVIDVAGLGWFRLNRLPDKDSRRLGGKVCLVTGAAQGFGEGIARELAAAGGQLIIADLNLTLAEAVAASLNDTYGEGTAWAVKVDVGDEVSVCAMMEQAVLRFGGLDLIVSNAGVLRAGGLEDMDLKTFEFVTKINYTAFFLVSKYGSRPMKLQARFEPEFYGDIVQINSKSGLEGSNRNFAYAGGKFGGIGLVQSFAKELVEDRIKVNAICPGNYYEGPLWSDPERGLFVQYLIAGKVPGAQTVDDVYQFYIAKVPMRRGCSPLDVTRAILYCVEQRYETGQAIPVTGGQNMLK